MRFLWRWIKRLILLGIVLVIALFLPVAYVETMCRGGGSEIAYQSALPPDQHRAESRTLMTYPEWHIVHAYDDYAKVIETGDPHDFGYLQSIKGFWSSLCVLSEQSAVHGGFDGTTKQTIYVIGVSFSAELVAKALYEETVGRVATIIRGKDRSALDDLSAQQAAAYAEFLQQIPWYKWDFPSDVAALNAQSTDGFRDRERAFALGLEFSAKAVYANAIASAVASVGSDALRLQMVVRGISAEVAGRWDDVQVIVNNEDFLILDTPRYRALTHLLMEMAEAGAQFVEIAGNDDLMFTAISDQAEFDAAMFSFARQGYRDYRHLIMVNVTDLAGALQGLQGQGLTLEHVHDY